MTTTDPIDQTQPKPVADLATKRGRLSLIMGIIALVLSQATLYLFIFTAVLAPLTPTTILLLSLGAGLTLFSAGLAIITGHTAVHVGRRDQKRGIFGLIFGYGTLVVIIITVILGVVNSNSLQDNANPTTHCIQTDTQVNCTTE